MAPGDELQETNPVQFGCNLEEKTSCVKSYKLHPKVPTEPIECSAYSQSARKPKNKNKNNGGGYTVLCNIIL